MMDCYELTEPAIQRPFSFFEKVRLKKSEEQITETLQFRYDFIGVSEYFDDFINGDKKSYLGIAERHEFANNEFDIVVNKLSHIEKAFSYARKFLHFEMNWNGKNSIPVSQDVYNRAYNFTINYANNLLKKKMILEEPEIFPTNDGSLILEWGDGKIISLNIKIPNEKDNKVIYYFEKVNSDDPELSKSDSNGETSANIVSNEIAVWFENASRME